jgi:hypothetical protein
MASVPGLQAAADESPQPKEIGEGRKTIEVHDRKGRPPLHTLILRYQSSVLRKIRAEQYCPLRHFS